jgi:hypothetical protein
MTLFPDHDDERYILEQRAKDVCRKWAWRRVALRPIIDHTPELQEFDRAMFALGEVVFGGAQGEMSRIDEALK